MIVKVNIFDFQMSMKVRMQVKPIILLQWIPSNFVIKLTKTVFKNRVIFVILASAVLPQYTVYTHVTEDRQKT